MAYVLLQPFGSQAWVRGDGSTTAVAINLNLPPWNIPSAHTVVSLSITDPLGVYSINASAVSNIGAGVATVTVTPAVTLSAIVQFNFSGYFI